MSKSHRVKVLAKRMVDLRNLRLRPDWELSFNTIVLRNLRIRLAWELSFNDRLFGYLVYSKIVSKAERYASASK